LGIDAAGKGRWIAVLLDADGFHGARLGSLREIVEWAEPVAAIGVDVPIGHAGGGARLADVEARRFVGPRRSSVFAAPRKEVFEANSQSEANTILAELGLPKLSRQAWGLVPTMKDAAGLAANDDRVFEVHPEVSFRELAGECLVWPKKSWNGLLLRRRLLSGSGIELPEVIRDLANAGADDVVDAAVAAWSARRIASGVARSLPDPPEDSGGQPVSIWY
jgi:predicted RNase H-like nuclease